jgi:hypothetical protein
MGIRSGILVAALALAPAMAAAQQMLGHELGRPQHEAGVDVAFTYAKPSGGEGHVLIGTPVDVRLGFVTSGLLEPELRIFVRFDSKQDGVPGAKSAYQINPDVNLLFNLEGYDKGVYLTAGGGVNLTKASGSPSASQFTVNGGVGTRVPYEHGAIRLEAFGRYDFKNATKGLPNVFSVGARIGLTLWH